MLRKTALTIVLLGALAAPAVADTITFKNGHEVHGRLVEETDKYVIFQVGNGKLKFDKKEIATFTEDADYGQRYFTIPKRNATPDNVTPGADGKPGRTFYVPPEATPEERKELKGVHARIEEELAKLGPSNEERARKLDLASNERATLDAAVANLGKVASSAAAIGAFGPKALPALAEVLQTGDTGAKGDAAAAVDDSVRRGDEGEVKWALGRYKIATLLTNVLDASGDDKSARARDNANRALETISSASQGWAETKDPNPTEAQRAATAKWKEWARKNDESWETANREKEAARKKLNADWRDMEDQKGWRKALARAVDAYGTTVTAKADGTTDTSTTPKTDDGGKVNPDIAKDATPEQLAQIAELKGKIKKTLSDVVGPTIDERKKKHAPSSDELQEMKFSLTNLADRRNRHGGVMQRQKAISEIVNKYNVKALEPLAEALDGANVVEDKSVATAVGQIAQGGKEDASILIRAYGITEKLVALLDFETDRSRSPAVRAEASKALEAISGISQGWPADVTSQNLTPEESAAKGRWVEWQKGDQLDFARTEKLRDDHRKALSDLLKKLDSPRNWKDALEAAPTAVSKAERDLKKG